MSPTDPRVSVVIPARDEEAMIGRTVASVRAALDGHTHEILVVDHDSADRTAEVARAEGATVIQADADTPSIGALRNQGVARARGSILVFLDADVTVGERWAARFTEVASELDSPSRLLTGSVCSIPTPPSWIEAIWFGERLDRPTHLGTGHLLMSREFFDRVGGFDPALTTGEDFDLSRRAVARGGSVRLDPLLEAVHHGFPRTLGGFLRREMWHGTGDATSLQRILTSKVALAALAFAGLHAVVLGGLVVGEPPVALVGFGALLLLLTAVTVVKFGPPTRWSWLGAWLLSYAYLLGRALSIPLGLISRIRRSE